MLVIAGSSGRRTLPDRIQARAPSSPCDLLLIGNRVVPTYTPVGQLAAPLGSYRSTMARRPRFDWSTRVAFGQRQLRRFLSPPGSAFVTARAALVAAVSTARGALTPLHICVRRGRRPETQGRACHARRDDVRRRHHGERGE